VALGAGGAYAVTRRHRLVHAALWPVLAVAVVLGFAMALHLRPPPPPGDATPSVEQRP
jgi:hypothetical protein